MPGKTQNGDRRLAAQQDVARILSEAIFFNEAFPQVLETFCENLQWDFAALWLVDSSGETLQCESCWTRAGLDFGSFKEETGKMKMPRGVGLPGRVWASGETTWVRDVVTDENFPRVKAATESGLHSALAFPIKVNNQMCGVMEFFSREIKSDAEIFPDTRAAIANQVGQFLKRTMAEESLRESEERYRAIAESAAYGILTMDEQSLIRSVNPAAEKILGYRPEELIGQSMTVIMPERFRSAHRAGVVRFLQTGKRNIPWGGVELPALHKTGREIPLEISFGASAKNGKHFFTGIFRDITERKEAEKARLAAEEEIKSLNRDLEAKVKARTSALRESNDQLESFIYTVAHDLRAPLRAMDGLANILLKDYAEKVDDDGKEFLKAIVGSARRMDTLIEDLLNYSRMSRSDLVFQPVDVREIILQSRRMLVQEIEKRSAQVEVQGEFPPVIGHEVTLEHVLTNLISNALKFVPAATDPHVRIWATENESKVRIWIADNGIGISPEYHEKIFGIFERLHSVEEFPGTGIGLAIVRKGVDRMEGKVGVESKPGQGSRFWVELPRA